MAEEGADPREVAWHPRFARSVIGHQAALATLRSAFASGKMHHAWLLTGEEGIGKATLAYEFARHVLAKTANAEQSRRWIEAKSHPNLFVLERRMTDRKPLALRAEIAVDDARAMVQFFSQTSAQGGWRFAIVDAADDLNSESANALLKLIEEPPVNSLILLVAHSPGRVLRTIRSRCSKLKLNPLNHDETLRIIKSLPINPQPGHEAIDRAGRLSGGSPGKALKLMSSEGATAFAIMTAEKSLNAAVRHKVIRSFSPRGPSVDDLQIFGSLLKQWVANLARDRNSPMLAAVHSEIDGQLNLALGYNLDRKQSAMELLQAVEEALKAA